MSRLREIFDETMSALKDIDEKVTEMVAECQDKDTEIAALKAQLIFTNGRIVRQTEYDRMASELEELKAKLNAKIMDKRRPRELHTYRVTMRETIINDHVLEVKADSTYAAKDLAHVLALDVNVQRTVTPVKRYFENRDIEMVSR